MKSYYELLGVPSDAGPDEIKRSFRREIARYHPDKVQHLGEEFQRIAGVRAAELTEAYRVLMDAALRADYDRSLAERPPPPPAAGAPAGRPAPAASPAPDPAPPADPDPPPPPATAPGGHDGFVRRAAMGKFRAAVVDVLKDAEEVSARGFDAALVRRSRSRLFRRPDPSVQVLGRLVPFVNAATVRESWALAERVPAEAGTPQCLFLMGTGLASPRELGAAIAEQRQRPRRPAGQLVLVPVDLRDWGALVPADAPAVVKTILERLRQA